MLQTILNNITPTKCVIINDSLEAQGKNVLLSIIKNHLKLQVHVHLFLFENGVETIKKCLPSDKISVYDYMSANLWISEHENGMNFLRDLAEKQLNGVVVIDSLAHVIIEYGLAETFRALHNLTNGPNILQITTVLHEDVLENGPQIQSYFQKLSSLSMKLIEMPNSNNRVDYFYKKPGGKIIKEIEEYFFKDGIFYTKVLQRPDPKIILANTKIEKLPEDMASFKITLNENDKKLRDNFTLPYLKTSGDNADDGKIIYNLDESDDWDEEDPDDDLDI